MAALLATWVGVFPGWAASVPPDYLIRNYGADDGLRNETIFSLAQDRQGYLWCATYGGLARFDGVRFTGFDSDNTPELGTRVIYSVQADRAGRLWIENEFHALTVHEEGKFHRVALPPGPDGAPAILSALREDRSGGIWIHTSAAQRFRWAPGKRELASPSSRPDGLMLVPSADEGGEDWYALVDPATKTTRYGSQREGRFVPVADPGGRTEFAAAICFPRQGGGTWMLEGAASDRTLRALLPDGSISAPRPLPRLTGDPPNSFVEDKAGNIWVGFREGGVMRIGPDGQQREFTTADGLASNSIRQLLVDREGNVWAATDGGGLSRFTPRRFQVLGRADGLPSEIIYSIAPASGGGLWVGTHGGGVQRLRDGKFSSLPGFDPFPWAVHVAPDDTLWVGDLMAGLGNLRAGQSKRLVQGTQINALCDDPAGGGWAGGHGLFRWQGDTAGIMTNWPNATTISSLACSPAGELWLGTINDGLWRGGRGTFQRMDSGVNPRHREIHALHLDAQGALWLATGGNGLSRFHAGRFTDITVADGLADRSIRGIAEDGIGNFWFTSLGGIFRIARSELEAFCDGRERAVISHRFDREDGLATSQGTGSSQAKIARTPDGRMWFATMRGLASTDPQAMTLNPLPPPVVIEELRVDGRSLSLQSPALPVIAPGARRIELHFTALSFTAPGKVRFRYRLEDRDDRWIDGGTQRFAAFDGLEPGEHRFHVLACNNDGVWNETGASLTFRVAPFFWETLWFRGSTGTAAMLFGVWGVRFVSLRKVRRRLAQLERQQAIDRERARIARDMHDDVGSALTQLTLLGSPPPGEPEAPAQTESRRRRSPGSARSPNCPARSSASSTNLFGP
jgi:streptogramin lyase